MLVSTTFCSIYIHHTRAHGFHQILITFPVIALHNYFFHSQTNGTFAIFKMHFSLCNHFSPLHIIINVSSRAWCSLLWQNMSTSRENHFRHCSQCLQIWPQSPSSALEDVLPWLFHKGKKKLPSFHVYWCLRLMYVKMEYIMVV